MRLDKFLKISRLIKRRTVAKEAADSGIISINGKVAKSSDKVDTGDIIELSFNNNPKKIEVIDSGDTLINPKPEELIKYL